MREEWTAEQHRQAAAASFRDEDLSFFTRASPASLLPPVHPDAPTVYSEDLLSLEFESLTAVGGLDISFSSSTDEGIAVLVVLSFPELKLLHTLTSRIDLSSTPYIHSYLSFRESSHYAALVDELRTRPRATIPQVLFVDGNGRWHPRQAGSAVAVGVKTGLPTIGVAKEYHPLRSSDTPSKLSGTPLPPLPTYESPAPAPLPPLPFPLDFRSSQKGMRIACRKLLRRRGDWLGQVPPDECVVAGGPGVEPEKEGLGLAGKEEDEDEVWGAAVFTSPSPSASNPLFVSPGHRLSLSTCIRLTLACCTEARVPEPVRRADAIGREEVRRIWGASSGQAG